LRRLTVDEADDIATSLASQYPLSERNIDPLHLADFDIAMRVIHTLRMELRTLRNRAAVQAAAQASGYGVKDKRPHLKIVK
jgi:hypothetical protein